jgi:hypothetical protein
MPPWKGNRFDTSKVWLLEQSHVKYFDSQEESVVSPLASLLLSAGQHGVEVPILTAHFSGSVTSIKKSGFSRSNSPSHMPT